MAIDKKIIAIAAVALIVIAGIATAIVISNNDSSSEGYTIVDGSGKEIKVSGPVKSVVTVNTNVPKAMKILGLDDYVTGISNYSSSNDAKLWEMFHPIFKNAKHMSVTKNMTAEEISKLGVKYVIAPVSSMTVSPDKEKAYAELGITVVKLDCFGDKMDEDFKTLLKLCLGENVETNDAYEKYVKMSNDVINTVITKASSSSTSDKTFLFYMSGKGFYNKTSSLSEITEKIYGKNALNSIPNLDLNGVTNSAGSDGIKEQVIALDAKTPVDKLFIRGSSKVVDAASAKAFWSDDKNGLIKQSEAYKDLNAVKSNEVYVLNTNVMSGPLTYVGYVLIAEASGIDTGYDVSKLISDYNKAYGFDEDTTGMLFGTSDNCNTFKEIIIE
ncbi:hypothetical protein [Candidatus Methanarcanum hacksteinii]|uniref:hypothetical protein n=2 Tax=Candidatus Methanarcanum hacksteinii TaxID=2911857 RepID=UPI0037DC0B08